MLNISQLRRHYGQSVALDNLDLTLEAGRVLAVLGPSGCGKSTLLKLISGLEDPDHGEIRIHDQLIARPGFSLAPEHRPINMVFQDYALWPHMNARKIIGYGLVHLSRQARDARVDELLDLLQLTPYADRLPSQLSGGQQQRVAIARALATDPEVLLFDEPLSNLDVQLRMEMRHELADLFERLNKTVLYVTHDPLEACAFADELLILRHGKLEQTGSTQALFANPATAWAAGLAGYDSRLTAQLEAPAENGLWRARIGEQTVLARVPEQDNCQPGDAVSLMLHSESMRLCDESASAVQQTNARTHTYLQTHTNVLSGVVKQCIFEGHRWRLRLDLGDALLSLISPIQQARGTTLQVAVSPQHVLAFR
ncbi:MAG: ABC transporter ATP-binding protein [Natronospirillum sp.]